MVDEKKEKRKEKRKKKRKEKKELRETYQRLSNYLWKGISAFLFSICQDRYVVLL